MVCTLRLLSTAEANMVSPPSQGLSSKAVVIADAGPVQPYLEKLGWGVQWELARRMTSDRNPIKASDFLIPNFRLLLGSNAEAAPKIPAFLTRWGDAIPKEDNSPSELVDPLLKAAFAHERSMKNVYAELDQEHTWMVAGSRDSLGCNRKVDDYYGGKGDVCQLSSP
jgi:hypothetical protein